MDVVLGVLLLDVVPLDFAAADDGAEGLVDVVGRVARAARGGIRGGGQLHVCVWLCLAVSALRRTPSLTHSKSTSTLQENPKSADRPTSPLTSKTFSMNIGPPTSDFMCQVGYDLTN